MKLSECRLKMESLQSRVRDDFAIDLAERVASYAPEAVNWEAVEAEIQELRTKIERLGAVNLEAIKEQEELESRAEFLLAQQRDLEEARRKLDSLIQRINAESVARFNATFGQVRENFQTLFRKLFGGGKADAVLLDPEDVLESGIEIIARPPGKEPCSISLLSGGEKTLTAVALLLAVFRSKPSPFCILDEVDAALDEANNERFNAVVRDFVADSQFIIITHSKRTMSAADILYGVTMQEPGVSKKIGVRFADIHKLNLEGATPAALAEAPQPQTVAGA
jgi:chromosome segregation protein